ncbi:glycoside hydrolase family 3 C-terminal domain-containing protein [Cellulomonas sp. P5_E12]
MPSSLIPRRGPARPSASRLAVCAGAATIALLVGGVVVPGAASADPAADLQSPPTAADAPWTKTVTWLVSQLTVAEKTSLVRGTTDPDPHGQAGYLPGVARLGIPEMRHVDALGINVYADATGLPSRIGLASSFDRSAYSTLGEIVGQEGRALDTDVIYGPQVDMSRYPSWTRNLTTNGEDAYVSAQFAATEINGIQSQGLLAQVKHVSMYNGQAQGTPSLVSSQAAHELYLKPAQAAIEDGGVSSMMCSYATFRIVGEQPAPQFSCGNTNLLTNIVKGQFGLKGFITSDYANASKATSDLIAGMDQEFISQSLTAAKLTPLVTVTSSTYDPAYANALDNAIARAIYEMERFGLLDNSKIPAAYQSDVPQHGDVSSTFNGTPVDKAAGSGVALKLAEESAVLLKNDANTLPLATGSKVAVVGPTGYLMPSAPGGERSRGFGDRNNYTPVKAIKAVNGTSNVLAAPGIDWIGTTVPAANLKQDAAGTLAGLVRTTTSSDAVPVVTTSTDTIVDGSQANLVKGYRYSWTGYIDVPTTDTYTLYLQRPYGTDSGVTTAYNNGVRPASAGTVSLAVDGTNRTLASPASTILQNDFPDGQLASNGQYLGKDNTGVTLAGLTAGLHQVTFTYNPTANSAQTPTLRFAWAPLAANTAAAVTAAQTADKTVIFVGSNNAGSGPSSSSSAGLSVIPQDQIDLINSVAPAAHAAGHQVVIVLNAGAAVAMPWASQADAILNMWYPGQEGGTATANLLYGNANPSGKLPITFPVDDAHTMYTDFPERTTATLSGDDPTVSSFKWTEGVNVGYRWYTDPSVNIHNYQPQYAFGFGLSYTSFAYSGLSAKVTADSGLDVTFTVTNTGTKAGADAPQVYLGASPDLAPPVYDSNGLVISGFEQSAQKLVQFDRVQLDPGASKTLTLHVDPQDVSGWDTVAQNWVVGTGSRTISLGAASNDIKLTVTKNVTSSNVAPEITTDIAATSSVAVGANLTLTAAASGSPAPTVQWQKSTDGTTWNDIAGATSPTYTLTGAVAADNGIQIRAVFENDLGQATTTVTTVSVTRAALSAPVLSLTTGVVVVNAQNYTQGTVGITWTASAPAASLKEYQILDGSTVLQTVAASSTSATLVLGAGTHTLSVKASPVDALVIGGAKTSASQVVIVDQSAPSTTVARPAGKAKNWTAISGQSVDTGSGASTVTVYLVEQRGSNYYYYTGSVWLKATSQSDAATKATRTTVPVSSTGAWTVPVTDISAENLSVSFSGTDKVGNTSPVVTVVWSVK